MVKNQNLVSLKGAIEQLLHRSAKQLLLSYLRFSLNV
jgi:hypothetical protein